ncbi:putative phosphoenolpyruvate synthase [Paratrimastix pyriformis]|uniref:Phosphoenolpyruvate synthase n=1 Tax=Paratrimastix pyriformis TaxID=342808 RepID=A0ABQ8UWG6_9EUKA|nr:putative phosphoenolpyruvate synthase [Paratrimastix pyriformis]
MLRLASCTRADSPVIGGKAANLGYLALRFPVPGPSVQGFVIPASCFAQFSAPIADRISAILAKCQEYRQAMEVSTAIRDLYLRTSIPDGMRQEIIRFWDEARKGLPSETAWAARSSGIAEDSADCSFAGQHDTVLNIKTADALLVGIKQVWSSLFSDRALAYRLSRNMDVTKILGEGIGVVVQRMVVPDVSGIMFTADPLTQNRSNIRIDASYGAGEGLVSGQVDPDVFTVDKHTFQLVDSRIGAKATKMVPAPEGGLQTIAVDPAECSRPSLSRFMVKTLAHLGAAIEEHYGNQPQDIEWCWRACPGRDAESEGQFFILQSRPITTLYPDLLPIGVLGIPSYMSIHDWLTHPDEPASPARALPGHKTRIVTSFNHIQVMMKPFPPLALGCLAHIVSIVRTAAGPPLWAMRGYPFADITDAFSTALGRAMARGGATMMLGADQAATIFGKQVQSKVGPGPGPGRRPWLGNASSTAISSWRLPAGARIVKRFIGNMFVNDPMAAIKECDTLMETVADDLCAKLPAPSDPAVQVMARIEETTSSALPSLISNFPTFFAPGSAAQHIIQSKLAKWVMPEMLPQVRADLNVVFQAGGPYNITTRMNQSLGRLGAALHSDVREALRLFIEAHASELSSRGAVLWPTLRSQLAAMGPHGTAFLGDFDKYLDFFGHRGVGEISFYSPRYSENPFPLLQVRGAPQSLHPAPRRALMLASRPIAPWAQLLYSTTPDPSLVGAPFDPRQVDQARLARLTAEAQAASGRIEAAVWTSMYRATRYTVGPLRLRFLRRMLLVGRTLAALREHHKWTLMKPFFGVRKALLGLGDRMVAGGLLQEREHVWMLWPSEVTRLCTVVEQGSGMMPCDVALLRRRVALRQRRLEVLARTQPPRMICLDGEVLDGRRLPSKDQKQGSLTGLGVSAGVCEGIARVIMDPTDQCLSPGEILVTVATDPGWTPLFVHAAGVVLECGGVMTHGSQVARELGIPCVSALVGATKAITTGSRIRVDGTNGIVEILGDVAATPTLSPSAARAVPTPSTATPVSHSLEQQPMSSVGESKDPPFIFTIFEPPPPGAGEGGASRVYFFYPDTFMSEANQMLFVGAIFTFFTFADKFESEKASSITTTKHRFACHECEGLYFLLGGDLSEPPSAIQASLEVLVDCFRFYYGSVTHIRERSQGDPRHFATEMADVGHQLITVFQSAYTDRFSQIYHPIPYTPLPADSTRLFIAATQALDAIEAMPEVLGGCIFCGSTVLCTHLDNSPTRLVLLKVCSLQGALQSHPATPSPAPMIPLSRHTSIPGPMSPGAAIPEIFYVYLTGEEEEALTAASAERHYFTAPFYDPAAAAAVAATPGLSQAPGSSAGSSRVGGGDGTRSSLVTAIHHTPGGSDLDRALSATFLGGPAQQTPPPQQPQAAAGLPAAGSRSSLASTPPSGPDEPGALTPRKLRTPATKGPLGVEGGVLATPKAASGPGSVVPHGLIVHIVGSVSLALILAHGGVTAILSATGAVLGGHPAGGEDEASGVLTNMELLRYDELGAYVEGRPPVTGAPQAIPQPPPSRRGQPSGAPSALPVARNGPEFLRTVLFCNHVLRTHPDASQVLLARPALPEEGPQPAGPPAQARQQQPGATGVSVALCRSVMGQQTFVQLHAPKGAGGTAEISTPEEAALRTLESQRFRQELRKRHKLWML